MHADSRGMLTCVVGL